MRFELVKLVLFILPFRPSKVEKCGHNPFISSCFFLLVTWPLDHNIIIHLFLVTTCDQEVMSQAGKNTLRKKDCVHTFQLCSAYKAVWTKLIQPIRTSFNGRSVELRHFSLDQSLPKFSPNPL